MAAGAVPAARAVSASGAVPVAWGARTSRLSGEVTGRTARTRYGWPVYGAALILGLVVAIAAVEIIAAVLGSAPHRALLWGYPAEVQWSEPSVLLASLVLVGAGAVLSSLALLPLRRRWLALWTDDPRFVGGLSRAEIREELEHAALCVPGVRGAVLAFDRRGVVVTTRAASWAAPTAVAESVRAELQAKLQELAPAYALRVRASACRHCVRFGRTCGRSRGHRVLGRLRAAGLWPGADRRWACDQGNPDLVADSHVRQVHLG